MYSLEVQGVCAPHAPLAASVPDTPLAPVLILYRFFCDACALCPSAHTQVHIKGGSKELSHSSGSGDPEAIVTTDAADSGSSSSLRWDYEVTFHDVSAVGELVVEVWRETSAEVSRPLVFCHYSQHELGDGNRISWPVIESRKFWLLECNRVEWLYGQQLKTGRQAGMCARTQQTASCVIIPPSIQSLHLVPHTDVQKNQCGCYVVSAILGLAVQYNCCVFTYSSSAVVHTSCCGFTRSTHPNSTCVCGDLTSVSQTQTGEELHSASPS